MPRFHPITPETPVVAPPAKTRRWRFSKVLRLGLAVLALPLGFMVGEPFWDAMSRDASQAVRRPADVTLRDRYGDLYKTVSDGRSSSRVEFGEISPLLVKAVVAREDSRYWEHLGFDPRGFARAFVRNLKDRRVSQGGSTVTMQLVEHIYARPQRNLLQKLQAKVFEAVMAARVENWAAEEYGDRKRGKEALLANYLNVVHFGHDTRGIVEGARYHFNKKPRELVLGEAAYLAGLLRAPSINSAYIDEDKARLARDRVRDRMQELGFISEEEAANDDFYVTPHPKRAARRGDGFTSERVRKELAHLVQGGSLPEGVESMNGIEVVLTLDVVYQTEAQRILQEELRKLESRSDYLGSRGELDGAVVVFDHPTGAALAVVGGRSFGKRQFNLAIDGRRPMASTIKPFVYASYLDVTREGHSAKLKNSVISRDKIGGLPGNLEPRETSRLRIPGPHSLIDGLAYSSNRMPLWAGARVGWQQWEQEAGKLGLWTGQAAPSSDVWIGACDVSPWQATASFMALARRGSMVPPHMIAQVVKQNSGGAETLYIHHARPVSVFRPRSADVVHRGLRDVLLRGTASGKARGLALKVPVAGKTGTSDTVADAWFIGYTDSLVVGVWIGFPESNQPMFRSGDGSSIAFPVFERILRAAPKAFPHRVEF